MRKSLPAPKYCLQLLWGRIKTKRTKIKEYKMKKQICIISIMLITAASIISQEKDFPKLTGPYLGQKPPGKTAEYFAPGIIAVPENFDHSAAVFSPDGKEVFWCTNVNGHTDKRVVGNLRLYTMKIVEGRWSAPMLAPFVKNISVERPVFSPDGSKLYFEHESDPHQESDFDIYFVERTGGGWSDPKPLSPLINSPAMERLHCVTADGSMYFSRDPFTSNEEIFVSRYINGEFTEPEKLGKGYNSDDHEAAILIAPDEDYMLILHTDAPQHRGVKLSISYKKADGSWSDRIEAPYYAGNGIALSPDENYLFLDNEGICWVSTSFINELKPKNLN